MTGEERPVCGICPSKRLPRDQFVVYDRPNREAPFNPADGYRYAPDGVPACVHPHKIGLEPDRTAPPPEPLPEPEPAATPRRRSRWSWSFRGR
ncbi:hypothetical protein GCM10010512_00030 [Streptomyces thermoviolaceus subsp. thermoviolaceus]|nr:hypothetical protein GCM10010499_35190 [Streptomyces thermoviolaceus subsp. apingens]GHA73959.1 hypothetical protein GCM10010512_00030 [Streptomyces thermoviolaceus subsp. thermoviolaceus]